ncbi:hypothetical protein B932_2635 [Gluconobacter oxydans H24]|nr:hypothetical protein B932_2635 [Gluconobacter oxydans H24]
MPQKTAEFALFLQVKLPYLGYFTKAALSFFVQHTSLRTQ